MRAQSAIGSASNNESADPVAVQAGRAQRSEVRVLTVNMHPPSFPPVHLGSRGRGLLWRTYWQQWLVRDNCLLAPNLTPISGPRFSSTSTFEIAFCNHLETHGHPPSRHFWTERSRRITACFRTTGGVWGLYGVEPGIDIPAADTARAIGIPSTQETDREAIRQYLRFDVNNHTWRYKESVERLQSQHAEVRPVRSQSTQAT